MSGQSMIEIVYNDESQIKNLDITKYPEIEFCFYPINSKNSRKKALTLKSHWAATLDPFVFISDNGKAVDAFYTEVGVSAVDQLIEYLKTNLKD